MSDGTNNFIPTSRNWQAGLDYGASNPGTMNGGTNNFRSTSRNWQAGHDHGGYAPNNNTMRGGTNTSMPTSMPTSRNWQARHDYGDYAPNTSAQNNTQGSYPRSVPVYFHADPVASRGAPHPRQYSLQERGITEPVGFAGFPVASHSLMQLPFLDNLMGREVNPSHRQINRGSSPHNMQAVDSPNEEETALKKLKKETYVPNSKKRTIPRCLYYREDAIKIHKELEKEKENDAMSCAVCLEDFVPNETVMVTPCKHMFHEACIVPWVKSNGQCPVCRFVISEPKRGTNNSAIAGGDDILTRELITVIRSLEEAFLFQNQIR